MELLFQTLDELDDLIAASRHILARYLGLGAYCGRRAGAVGERRQPLRVGEHPLAEI